MPLDKVLGLFADNKEVTQLIAKSVPAIMGFHQANKSKNAIEDYQTKLDNIEKSRQQIVNPYANVTNPFANMQVATKAAEMQAEQADISLANTLDNLRQTGAGGATALAQAALRSKQGITANIQKQEAQNQKLRASGEQQLQQVQLNEARRVQAGLMGEAKRIQDVEVQAKDLEFRRKEQREMEQLDRKQAQITGAAAQQASASAQKAGAISAGIGAVGNIASAGIAASAKG